MSPFLKNLRGWVLSAVVAGAGAWLYQDSLEKPEAQTRATETPEAQAEQAEQPEFSDIYATMKPSLPPAGEYDSLDIYNDTTGIADLLADFARTKTGRRYIALADCAGIAIVFNRERCAKEDASGLYSARTVSLAGNEEREDLLSTLAHEMEHAYNDVVMGAYAAKTSLLSPSRQFIVMRLDEADAFTAQSCYTFERRALLSGATTPLTEKECHDFFFKVLPITNELYAHHIKHARANLIHFYSFLTEEGPSGDLRDDFLEAQKRTPSTAAYHDMLRGFGGLPFGGKGALAEALPSQIESLALSLTAFNEAEKGTLHVRDTIHCDIINAGALAFKNSEKGP